MKLLRSVLAGVLLLSTTFGHTQTVDEVINKHIAAIGGKDVINKIKSRVTESETEVMGIALPSTTTLVPGKGMKQVSTVMGQEIVMCITSTGGWMINPVSGSSTPASMTEKELKESQSLLEVATPLFYYKEKGSKAELVGREKVDDINAIKIKLTDKNGKESFYYIDPTTNYLIQEEHTVNIQGRDETVSTSYSDFKKTDIGFVMPFTITSNNVGSVDTIKKVEFNKTIDPKIFEMPK